MGLNELSAFLKKSNALIRKLEQEGIEPSPVLARKSLEALALYVGESPEVALIVDKTIQADGRGIPVRIYHPLPSERLPIMLFLHGGGHMCGSIEIYDAVCRKICISSKCVLISVDYRLAPEFPYPAGLDDCREVLYRLKEILEGINSDCENVVIAGDSGGGALAAAISSEERCCDCPPLAGQILIYASLDYTKSSESYTKYSKGYLLETDRISWYFDNYFQNGEDRVNASPLFKTSENVPPTLIISAEYDPLVGDSMMYGVHLAEKGVSVEYVEYPSMVHAFLFLERLVPEIVSDSYSKIGAFFKKVTNCP